MSFKSLDEILKVLNIQKQYEEQPFQRLLNCWSKVVGAKIALHTRPVSIQRDVLWVATSSAAWAQNLTFDRRRLLASVNELLPTPLVDIRFSTADWHNSTPQLSQPSLQQQHPSFLDDAPFTPNVRPITKDPQATFKQWAELVQRRSHSLPLCPTCKSPTPPGELQRWRVCCICAAKEMGG